ncbi:hypothetical protein [Microbacterium sp. NPDC058345]|uniref:hypothetical protein n=1 Tax=Microbacterium sp. NPDC058345 TaxID=3346455 RepID=UPI0036564C04
MSVFVPIGIAGAVIAIACALATVFALLRGAAGLAGGAIGVWIVGAMLSVSASFANLWTPVIVALVALAGALVIGGVGRPLVRAGAARRVADAPVTAVAQPTAAPSTPVAQPTAVARSVESAPRSAPARQNPAPRTEALPIAS